MDDLSMMLSDKKKYKNLKTNINLIINQLNSAIENLEISSNDIKNMYNIDTISIDEKKLFAVRQDLINRKNFLKNIVMVELNKELNEIEDNIESMG